MQSIHGCALFSFETGSVVVFACEALDSLGWGPVGQQIGSQRVGAVVEEMYLHDEVDFSLIRNHLHLFGLQLIFLRN